MSRLMFVQSPRWSKRIDGGNGGPVYPYSAEHCAYCARPVRPDARLLRTARTNDGEWWLVSLDEDLSGEEWKDFQDQLDGSRAPTILPIGPDCLRDHPEFAFAVFDDNLDVMGSGKGHLYTREVAEQRRGRGKKEGT